MLRIDASRKSFVTYHQDGVVRIWDLESCMLLSDITYAPLVRENVLCMHYDSLAALPTGPEKRRPDQRGGAGQEQTSPNLFLGTNAGRVYFWSGNSNKVTSAAADTSDPILALAPLVQTTRFASLNSKGVLTLWNTDAATGAINITKSVSIADTLAAHTDPSSTEKASIHALSAAHVAVLPDDYIAVCAGTVFMLLDSVLSYVAHVYQPGQVLGLASSGPVVAVSVNSSPIVQVYRHQRSNRTGVTQHLLVRAARVFSFEPASTLSLASRIYWDRDRPYTKVVLTAFSRSVDANAISLVHFYVQNAGPAAPSKVITFKPAKVFRGPPGSTLAALAAVPTIVDKAMRYVSVALVRGTAFSPSFVPLAVNLDSPGDVYEAVPLDGGEAAIDADLDGAASEAPPPVRQIATSAAVRPAAAQKGGSPGSTEPATAPPESEHEHGPAQGVLSTAEQVILQGGQGRIMALVSSTPDDEVNELLGALSTHAFELLLCSLQQHCDANPAGTVLLTAHWLLRIMRHKAFGAVLTDPDCSAGRASIVALRRTIRMHIAAQAPLRRMHVLIAARAHRVIDTAVCTAPTFVLNCYAAHPDGEAAASVVGEDHGRSSDDSITEFADLIE